MRVRPGIRYLVVMVKVRKGLGNAVCLCVFV